MTARPFADLLREHGGGSTHDELSEKLQELVAAVTTEGKGGSLTFTVSVKPAGRGSGALEVAADIKLKAPKTAPTVSIFYATPSNGLTRQDPNQMTMELRTVPSAHKGVA
jgi:hypothetical protein